MTGADERGLTLSRFMPVPLAQVWAAWADPDRLPLWWGPRGFTCETKEMDLRDGGQWRFDMIAPDGTVFPNRHRFTRIEPQAAIDYLLDDDATGNHHFTASVRFIARDGGTEVTLTMTFPTAAERDRVEAFGAVAFGYTTLDCLAEAASPDTLSLTRILDASPARVWNCWTRPEDIAHWLFPKGISILSTDFAPLATADWRTVMRRDGTGETMAVRGRFETVEAPRRLVFTHGWEDAQGDVATLTRVMLIFDDLGGRTKLVLTQQGLASQASRDGHREGWGDTLDHLAGYLAG